MTSLPDIGKHETGSDARRSVPVNCDECECSPFHHLPFQERCEIKFHSRDRELLKATVFTGKKLSSLLLILMDKDEFTHSLQISAIRTRAYNVLRTKLCDCIPLPGKRR